MKKYLILAGAIIIIALGFYLGVKSGKIIEAILGGGGISGVLAVLFRKITGGNRGGSSDDIKFSLSELEGIRGRYRTANDRIQSGLAGAKHETNELRKLAERDRERIRGYEDAGSGVREAADELDYLIRRIRSEGID